MLQRRMDYRARVVYIADAKAGRGSEPMKLSSAIHTAIDNHRAGTSPVIIGKDVQLVGIDAIRAVRMLEDFPLA